jgi:predicted dinucleotide-binding enzyme
MRIGVIGSGQIGGNLARLFAAAGHSVKVANARGPESLAALAAEAGENLQPVDRSEVTHDVEVVVLATHWITPEALPAPGAVAGKVVIDAMNAYGRDGQPLDLGDATESEETAKRLPGARLVKAFNTIWYKHLAEEGRTDLPLDERRAVLVAGDDPEAKAVIGGLIIDIGFAPVDSGGLREGGRRQAPGSPFFAVPLTAAVARRMLSELEP